MEVMKTLLTIVFVVLFGVCLINYSIDFAFYLINRYCRFHIGRWKFNKWKLAIEKKAQKWLKITPTVKITDNSRYILLDILKGNYRSRNIQSWQKAALLLGLNNGLLDKSKFLAQAEVIKLLDSKGEWRHKPNSVDCGMLSYAIMNVAKDLNFIKPAMDYTIEIINRNINDNGMISYCGGATNPDMYVDTIGLTIPFLVLYAFNYNKTEYEDLAFHQIEMFRKYGLLKGNSLPNHAFNINNKLPLGVYGWGRGTGWYVIGMVDSYNFFKNANYKEKIKIWIHEAAEDYLSFQHIDGGFGAILQSPNTYDSSITAIMAWFYSFCSKLFLNNEYLKIAEKCIFALLKRTRISGAIDYNQGDTKGIGIFAQSYDIMPFSQGMVLRALSEIEKNNFL